MMKRVLLGFLLFISGTFLFMNIKKYKTEIIVNEDLAVYVNDELVSSIPKKGEAMFIKAVCDNGGKASWDNDKWGLLVTNMTKKNKCNLYFYEGQTVFNFDYTGSEQVFTVPVSGTYKLETWGAQGGFAYSNEASGGYGGYSKGNVFLNKESNLYLAVGGKGADGTSYSETLFYNGGYNGGGNAMSDSSTVWGAGGGATSIQNLLIKDGQLQYYENNKNLVLIVAGAGGGGGWHYRAYLQYKTSPYLPHVGGSGGGYKGNNGVTETNSLAYGGTQTVGGKNGSSSNNVSNSSFGIGGNYYNTLYDAGGGAGFYGGGSAYHNGSSGAGGSGYIGNSLLKEKAMYCYNCEESNEESTKTISTTCSEETPTENCAKKGNGYARVTLVSIDE